MILITKTNDFLDKIPVWIIYLLGFAPFIFVFVLSLSNKVGPDPLRVLEHKTGIWSLNYLIFVLSISLFENLIKLKLLRFRRCLGLLAFYYSFIHLMIYLILDRQLNFFEIFNDIIKRPYIFFGFLAFIFFLPLVFTSNNFSKNFFGIKSWLKIHTLVYLIAIFSIIHYILLVKSWPIQPIILSFLVILLITLRLKKIKSLFFKNKFKF